VSRQAWRAVVKTEEHPGWYGLTLECGDVVTRPAHKGRPAPKRVNCPACLDKPFVYVRTDGLAGATWLTARQRVAAVALAAEELALAEALVMIHGPRRGAQRYMESGRPIVFGADASPWVPVYPDPDSLT
jgi:hypothetical protein